MERIIDGKYLTDTFDSLQEFADIAVKCANGSRTYIYSSTLDAVRDGWPNEVTQAIEIAESAVNAVPVLAEHANFTPTWDVSGAEVDVARYLSGEPECMIDFPARETLSFGRTITLVSSIDANSSVNTAGDYRERGTMAVALALALSRLGYSTEMWVDNCGADIGEYSYRKAPDRLRAAAYQRVRIKSTSDELDPARLMFAFGAREMLNEISFGTWDGWPGAWRHTHSDYGHRGVAWNDRPGWATSLYPDGTVFITGDVDGAKSMTEAVTYELRKLGLLG